MKMKKKKKKKNKKKKKKKGSYRPIVGFSRNKLIRSNSTTYASCLHIDAILSKPRISTIHDFTGVPYFFYFNELQQSI